MSTYACAICGDEITKRNSYGFHGGRACRHHQEAIEHHTIVVNTKQFTAMGIIYDYWKLKAGTNSIIRPEHIRVQLTNLINSGYTAGCREVIDAVNTLMPSLLVYKYGDLYGISEEMVDAFMQMARLHIPRKPTKFTYRRATVRVEEDIEDDDIDDKRAYQHGHKSKGAHHGKPKTR